MGRLNRALPDFDTGDGFVSEKAVHPLHNLRNHLLDQRSMGGHDHQLQNAFRLFPRREADRFGAAHFRMGRPDNLRPAGDDIGLDKAKPAKRRAPDMRHQLANRLGSATARALVRLCTLLGPALCRLSRSIICRWVLRTIAFH